MSICFVGLGKLGMPCAEAIAQKGVHVSGFDVEARTSSHVIIHDSLEGALRDANIVFVAVPTPHEPRYDGSMPSSTFEPKDFDYTTAKSVIKQCDELMTKDQLLVLISTVLPGTVRREIIPLINNARFVYNPYLIAMGTVAWDMVNPEMLMIGTEDGEETGDAKELIDFYKPLMENDPRIVVGTWDECECIKVFYNTFISAKIGLVNMIQDVAEKQGNINVDVVTAALRDSTQRIMGPSYMRAGMGDGGACHPRDNIALRYMAEELELGYDLFEAIMEAREIQAENMAEAVLRYGDRVLFTSDSYKAGVEIKAGSYSLLVQHYVKELGGQIVDDNPDVIFKVHESDDIELDFAYALTDINTVIFDPWRTHVSKNPVIHYGNTRARQ